MNKKIKWITQTAINTALVIILQVMTSSLGNTFVTGSLVNMVLIVSVLMCGVSVGTAVAATSPIYAKLIGIGPLWSIIPCIALGNITLVLVWHLLGNKKGTYIGAWIAGTVAKFIVLYVGIVKFMIPVMLDLPEKQASMISATFSMPQLITAGIGGGIALAMMPMIRKAQMGE